MFPQIESEMSDLQKEIEKGLIPAKPRGIWAAYASMIIGSGTVFMSNSNIHSSI